MRDTEPLTWACTCGQINLLSERDCFACPGSRDETWDPADANKMSEQLKQKRPKTQ